jgi:hypothetical protein
MCVAFQNVSVHQTLSLQMTWLPGTNFESLKFQSFKHMQLTLLSMHFKMHAYIYAPLSNIVSIPKYIVTRIPIARQRLGKHIPAEAYAHNNKASIARQRISK